MLPIASFAGLPIEIQEATVSGGIVGGSFELLVVVLSAIASKVPYDENQGIGGNPHRRPSSRDPGAILGMAAVGVTGELLSLGALVPLVLTSFSSSLVIMHFGPYGGRENDKHSDRR
jgi:hypothetical protein